MSGRFEVLDTPIQGLKILQRRIIGDHRGYLERMFCSSELETLLAGKNVAQINRTLTVKSGTIRGMHFQHQPHAEIKLVSCLRGEVFDVAVDLRSGSPTFLQWHSAVLSADNRRTMFIPEGFAHGFQALVDDCELLYMHTAEFQPRFEGGANAKDPLLAIRWPMAVTELSPRDAAHAFLTSEFPGIRA